MRETAYEAAVAASGKRVFALAVALLDDCEWAEDGVAVNILGGIDPVVPARMQATVARRISRSRPPA